MGLQHVVSGRVAAAVAAVALACVSAAPLEASTMRCRGGVVSVGDSSAEVLARCGEPDGRSRRTKQVRTTNRIGIAVERTVDIETWSYDRGVGKFVLRLIFVGGRLDAIERGPRRE